MSRRDEWRSWELLGLSRGAARLRAARSYPRRGAATWCSSAGRAAFAEGSRNAGGGESKARPPKRPVRWRGAPLSVDARERADRGRVIPVRKVGRARGSVTCARASHREDQAPARAHRGMPLGCETPEFPGSVASETTSGRGGKPQNCGMAPRTRTRDPRLRSQEKRVGRGWLRFAKRWNRSRANRRWSPSVPSVGTH